MDDNYDYEEVIELRKDYENNLDFLKIMPKC